MFYLVNNCSYYLLSYAFLYVKVFPPSLAEQKKCAHCFSKSPIFSARYCPHAFPLSYLQAFSSLLPQWVGLLLFWLECWGFNTFWSGKWLLRCLDICFSNYMWHRCGKLACYEMTRLCPIPYQESPEQMLTFFTKFCKTLVKVFSFKTYITLAPHTMLTLVLKQEAECEELL